MSIADTKPLRESKATQKRTPLNVGALVEEHFDYLYRYAFRYFRSHEEAEDIVQETFLAATRAAEQFQGTSTPRTWLTGILRHKTIDKLRSKGRDNHINFDELESDPLLKSFDAVGHWRAETGPTSWNCGPDDALKQKQFFSAVDKCLSGLPRRMRQIFLLRELEGFERSDIGIQLELTASNVGVLLHRARLALQACLQSTWFAELSKKAEP